MTQLHAQPYDTSANGFFFTSLEEYEEKYEANLPVEEYEIQFIEGTDEDAKLSEIAALSQGNLATYFELIDECFSDDDLLALSYLTDLGLSLENALERYTEVCIYRGRINDWAYEMAQEMGLCEFGLRYFDEAAFVRDCECNSEITELERDVWVTNCLEF